MRKERWQGGRSSALIRVAAGMTIISDPLFYLLAVPAILALGLGKGGFAGLGMISTPLLALSVPPLQAAAILLPILLCQDVASSYSALGQFSTRTLATSFILLPLAIASNFFGLWLARRTPTELFYKLAYLLVLVISLGLCWRGASAILEP
jgi:uncharacterized membrane protein YfcA